MTLYKGIVEKMTLTGQLGKGRYKQGVESWWGCSDSDSGLLIDSVSGSDCDSGSDTKYKINNTLIVGGVSTVRAKKNGTFRIYFGFHSFERKIFIPVITHACRIASAQKKN